MQTQGKQEKKLLNYQEAAEKLGLAPQTLRTWVHQGRIPFLKLGRAVRFSPEMLQQFMTEGVQ